MSARIPTQWILEQLPWLEPAVPYIQILQELWHDYQGLAVLCGFVFVWRKLRAERLILSERIDTLGQIVRATRDETEAALAAPPLEVPSASPQQIDPSANWQRIRATWREARDRLELLIDEIGRAKIRAKYSKMDRYSYRAVINALESDDLLASAVADKLRAMDTAFNRAKFKPSRVSDAEVSEFDKLYELPSARLPRLPQDQEPNPDPTPESSAAMVGSRAA